MHEQTVQAGNDLDALLAAAQAEKAKRRQDWTVMYLGDGESREVAVLGVPILLQFHWSKFRKRRAYGDEFHAICGRERAKDLNESVPCRWCDDEDGGWTRGPHVVFTVWDPAAEARRIVHFNSSRYDRALAALVAVLKLGRRSIVLSKGNGGRWSVGPTAGVKVPAGEEPFIREEIVYALRRLVGYGA